MKKTFLIWIVLFLFSACGIFQRTYINYEYDKIPMSKNRNVCKNLNDTIIVYAVFVDVYNFQPWTKFEIESTLDSLQKASVWIENQAKSFDKKVFIQNEVHNEAGKLSFHEKEISALLSLNGMGMHYSNSIKKINSWSDLLSKRIGKKLKYVQSTKVKTKLKINSLKSLNLALRDKFEKENVAIVFFVNGFMERVPSYSFNCESDVDVEFSLITSKETSVIAHEILHLFGAVDLYPNHNFPNFNYAELASVYPNELMRIQHKSIEKLSISPITAYFLGWKDSMSYKDTRLLLHKERFIEY